MIVLALIWLIFSSILYRDTKDDWDQRVAERPDLYKPLSLPMRVVICFLLGLLWPIGFPMQIRASWQELQKHLDRA